MTASPLQRPGRSTECPLAESSGLGKDITLNGEQYVLHEEDGSTEDSFRRIGSIDLHGINPQIPVSEEWDFGVKSEGAGQMRRREPNNRTWFGQGVDVSSNSGARLSGRKIALSPTFVPIDKGAWFFEDRPTGNAVFEAGNGTAEITDTTKNYSHSNGVTTKAGIFFTAVTTNDGTVGSSGAFSIGFSDGTNDAAVGINDSDAQNPATSQTTWSETKCLVAREADNSGFAWDCAVSSFTDSTTQFTLDFDTTSGAADILHWLVIGGADVSAKVVYFATGTGAADTEVAVIGAGFQPDCVIFLSGGQTATGEGTSASISIGVAESGGAQWSHNIRAENGVVANTGTRQSNTRCLSKLANGSGAVEGDARWKSMDTDGFTITIKDAFSTSNRVAALCLKGVRVKATTQTILTTVGATQDAQDPSFTSEAFLNVGGIATALSISRDNASLGIGVASATGEVETAAFFSRDSAGAADTARLADTTGALSIMSVDTSDPENDRATCAFIDMGTPGWLTWGIEGGTAHYFHTLAFAGLSDANTKMIHYHNAQSLTKMSVGGTSANPTITEREAHDWGAGAVAGPFTKFNGTYFMPLGENQNAQQITAIGDIGTNNSYSDVQNSSTSIKAHAFADLQDGTVARMARGLNQFVDVTVGATPSITDWSGGDTGSTGYIIGSSDTNITNLTTYAEGLYVSKEDGIYTTDPQGGANPMKTWPPSSKAASNGQGTVNFTTTKAVTYNHESGKFFVDGESRAFDVGVDAIPGNGNYPNITHEPFQGKYLESWTKGKYQYDLLTITESSTTKTYIVVTEFDRDEQTFQQEFFDQLDGVCRGIFIDSDNLLWVGHVGGGNIIFYQLGDDAGPDPGRNAIGYGEDDNGTQTFRLYLGEVDFGHPFVLKQLRSVEAIAEQTHTGLTVIPSFFHDINTVTETTPMSGTISATGRTQLYVNIQNTNDTFYHTMAAQQWEITSATNTDTSPFQMLMYRINAFLRPEASDFAAAYEIIIDTGLPYDGGAMPIDALTLRTNLFALKGSAPVTVEGVGSITHTMIITEVSELTIRQSESGVSWVVVLSALDWVDSA